MSTDLATIYSASVLHFLSKPEGAGDDSYEYYENGAIAVIDGKISKVGDASKVINCFPKNTKIVTYPNHLITPGFIDTHTHYPQVEVIASHGEQLLDWLNNYTFPAEKRFEDRSHANKMASMFLDELLRNGTTTASVFASVHKQSVEAFFQASTSLNTRMICGKVMMNRNAPPDLCDTSQSSYDDSKALIQKWHNIGRQRYAITPRFAISSTAEQLEAAGQLYKQFPDTYMQTHLSENIAELDLVKSLFPNNKDYLDVYDQYGLLGSNSTFAHGIHLSDRELDRLHETGSKIAFCPTSNLFLGSGLLDTARLDNKHVRYSLASDIGAGTSFSMLKTMSEAYKVSQLMNTPLSPLFCFYLATLGNATSLGLENKIGSFKIGNEADFIVLDLHSSELMKLKQNQSDSLSEKLFSLIILGDDRNVSATYIQGELKHELS